MDELRGILAVLGIGVVAFVYWYTRRERSKEGTDGSTRHEPQFLAETEEPASTDVRADAETGAVQSPLVVDDEPTGNIPEKIVTIRTVAKNGGTISGDELILTLRGLGLRHGQFGIFHRQNGDDDAVVFSVANLIEPGSFDLANIREQALPGVSMFMVLPGPTTGPEAFDTMVATARTLAKSIDGEVLDSAGSSLSIQRERFIREEIIQYEYEHGLNDG